MMRFALRFSVISSVFIRVFAASSALEVQTIHSFPNGTSAENLAVRQNGQILVTPSTSSDLFIIDPVVDAPAVLVHSFAGYSGLHGIVEVEPDQFYLAASNSTAVLNSVFHVDMSHFPDSTGVTKVTDFPEAKALNGMGLLSKEEGLVYVADSSAGVVLLLNVHNGAHEVAINNTLTPPVVGNFGVNGVHVFQASPQSIKVLYFSSTGQELVARVPIHDNGFPAGQPEVIASNLTVDDFTLDKEGNVFQALHVGNQVVRIDSKTHNVLVLAGSVNSTEFEDATSVQFGRLNSDENSIYVTTASGAGVGGSLKRIALGNLA